MTSASPPRPADAQQIALPPVYRPEQVLSPAAYRRHVENRKLQSQFYAGLALIVLIGLSLLLLPVLAPFLGELLGDAVSGAAQPEGI